MKADQRVYLLRIVSRVGVTSFRERRRLPATLRRRVHHVMRQGKHCATFEVSEDVKEDLYGIRQYWYYLSGHCQDGI